MITYSFRNDSTSQNKTYKLFGWAVVPNPFDTPVYSTDFWGEWDIITSYIPFNPTVQAFDKQAGTARTTNIIDGNVLVNINVDNYNAGQKAFVGISNSLVSGESDPNYRFSIGVTDRSGFDWTVEVWENGAMVYTGIFTHTSTTQIYLNITVDSSGNVQYLVEALIWYNSANTVNLTSNDNHVVAYSTNDGNLSISSITVDFNFTNPTVELTLTEKKILLNSKEVAGVWQNLRLNYLEVRGTQGILNLPEVSKIKVDIFNNEKKDVYFPQGNPAMINNAVFWRVPLPKGTILCGNEYYKIVVKPQTNCILIFDVDLEDYYQRENILIDRMEELTGRAVEQNYDLLPLLNTDK